MKNWVVRCGTSWFFSAMLAVVFAVPVVGAGSLGHSAAYRNSAIQVDGSPQTVQTRTRKSRKKRKSRQKVAVVKRTKVPIGVWGGDDVVLNIEENRVVLEFICAHGMIESSLNRDAKGNFSAKGTYNTEQPGSTKVETTNAQQSAMFVGKISGDLMTVRVSFTDSGKQIGEFRLVRGKTLQLRSCS